MKFLKSTRGAVLTAIFCTLLWGTAFPCIKLSYSLFDIGSGDVGAKLLLAGLRFTAAGLTVFLGQWLVQKKPPKPGKGDIIPVGLLGTVQTAAQYIFTYIGIGFTTGTNTSVITACASFFTVLAAPLFFKSDRLGVMKILGCALGFAGVLAINGFGVPSIDTLFGDFMILCSTISAAGGNLLTKKVTARRNPFAVTAYQLVIGGVILTAAGFICGGKLSLESLEGDFVLLWLAFVSAGAFSLWTALLKFHDASKISVFNLLVPVFGTLLSGLMLGENVLNLQTLLSLALISAGIFCVNRTKSSGV